MHEFIQRCLTRAIPAATLVLAALLLPGCTCRSADSWAQNAAPIQPTERIAVPGTVTRAESTGESKTRAWSASTESTSVQTVTH